jgi:hypothetical protein
MSADKTVKGLTFEEWLSRVDSAVDSLCGMSADDLDDWHYWDSWNAGESPRNAAHYVVNNACDACGVNFNELKHEIDNVCPTWARAE